MNPHADARWTTPTKLNKEPKAYANKKSAIQNILDRTCDKALNNKAGKANRTTNKPSVFIPSRGNKPQRTTEYPKAIKI